MQLPIGSNSSVATFVLGRLIRGVGVALVHSMSIDLRAWLFDYVVLGVRRQLQFIITFLILAPWLLISVEAFASSTLFEPLAVRPLSDNEKMKEAYINGDNETSRKYAQEILKESNDPDALRMMGYFERGEKSKEYYSRAVKEYVRAAEDGDWTKYQNASNSSVKESDQKYWNAKFLEILKIKFEQNNPKAIFIMSTCYHDGFDLWKCHIKSDKAKRLELLKKAADLDDRDAQSWLGEYYYRDKKDPQSYQLAKLYLTKAYNGARGYSLTSNYLAELYISEKNISDAIKILKSGTHFGNRDAQRALAEIYRGQYGEEYLNLPAAYMLANATVHWYWNSLRDRIYSEMKNDERLIALALDKRCAEKDYFECDQFILPVK